MVAAVAFVATVALMTTEENQASDVPPAAAESAGEASLDPLSEETTIAEGENFGASWRWSGYMSEVNGDSDPALCTTWTTTDSDAPPDTVCTVHIKEGLPDGKMIASDTVGSPFYGIVAEDVSAVRMELDDGRSVDAEVYESPSSWNLAFDFFVGFAPESADTVTLLAEANGTVVDRERHSELPVLVVSKEGSGTGTVTAYSVEELRCGGEGCHEPRKWIDCGSQCRTEVEDTELRLEATAGEGSTFSGWSGACAGQGTCTVTINADTSVAARFEPSN
jgi:hypothetical protein